MNVNGYKAPVPFAGARLSVRADEYLVRRGQKTREEFVLSHPEPLLVIEDRETPKRVVNSVKTNVVSYADVVAQRARRFLAAPVVKRTFDAFKGFIWIGREDQCDICLGYDSVSKLQAQICLKRPGEYELSDAGSTNGTFIDDVRIEQGRLQVLEDGARIRFGSVETIFFTSASFWDFVVANQR